MSHTQIPDRLAERLNALMRPADDISNYAISADILAAVIDAGSEDARVAALAYVFANQPFARWSGPETPATEYPATPDFEGRDRAAFEVFLRDHQFTGQLIAFGAQVVADEVDVPERARRAWAFLTSKCSTPMATVTALTVMLQDGSPFLGRATPPTDVRFPERIPNEECERIRWRNRTVIARLNGIRSSDAITQKASLGAATLAALSEVRDERERAFVLGDFLNNVDDLLEAFGEAARRFHEAAEKGEPCSHCDKVHKRGERHEQHE